MLLLLGDQYFQGIELNPSPTDQNESIEMLLQNEELAEESRLTVFVVHR